MNWHAWRGAAIVCATLAIAAPSTTAEAARIEIVEYFHPAFGHYFMTGDSDEIAGLDAGAYGGAFVRTGRRFDGLPSAAPGTVPVCRFFTTPGTFGPKSSHFYTASPEECAGLKLNPAWVYEKIAFHIAAPAGGACPSGTAPVYRMYNNGQTGAPNHRFTTDVALYQQFTSSSGWAPEGIRFCTSIANGETSYANFKEIGLVPRLLPRGSAPRAHGNFFGQGKLDFFHAQTTYWPPRTIEEATPSRFEFWRSTGDDTFELDTSILPSSTGCLHPRKPIVADFNHDGRPDIFVACHGFDAPPYPGEKNVVLLSQPDGKYALKDASPDVGFFHGAAAADMNGDGRVDVIAARFGSLLLLRGDGQGSFHNEPFPLPPSLTGKTYFSVELVDVDGNGSVDLLLGGHEWQAPTVVLLNPGNSDFSQAAPVVIPAVPGEGVVLDFVVTGSGAARTLWVLRTSGGDGTFYASRTVQSVRWPSLESTVVLNQRPANVVWWIIPTTLNGTPVIASDNAQPQEMMSVPIQ